MRRPSEGARDTSTSPPKRLVTSAGSGVGAGGKINVLAELDHWLRRWKPAHLRLLDEPKDAGPPCHSGTPLLEFLARRVGTAPKF